MRLVEFPTKFSIGLGWERILTITDLNSQSRQQRVTIPGFGPCGSEETRGGHRSLVKLRRVLRQARHRRRRKLEGCGGAAKYGAATRNEDTDLSEDPKDQ